MSDKYNIIIFGATGITGQHVVEEVAKASEREKSKGMPPVTWAVAGRNKQKLDECLKFAEKESGIDFGEVKIFKVDINDKESIDKMTENAEIILNCVGPYHHYGEPVVKSCIKNGASQLDLCGEPHYINEMKISYNEAAKNSGVYVVSSCALGSIPADVGLVHLSSKFPGRLNSAKGYLTDTGGLTTIHTATMESMSLSIANYNKAKELHRKINPNELPKPRYPAKRHYGVHKERGLWAVPFISEEDFIYNTQRFLHEKAGTPFVQYQGFIASTNMPKVMGTGIGFLYLAGLSYFSATRNFLFKHPKLLTAGIFSKEGPSREDLRKAGFSFTLVGQGWKEKKQNESDYSHSPNHKLTLEISGPDPAYRGTSIMMVACAMTLFKDRNKMIEKGGVLTPGITFYNTSIIDRLKEGGLTIEFKE